MSAENEKELLDRAIAFVVRSTNMNPDVVMPHLKETEKLYTYVTSGNPMDVFIRMTSHNEFSLDDVIEFLGMIIVHGRGLRAFWKNSNSEYSKRFFEICMKYKIKTSYNTKKIKNNQAKWPTKAEHVFAAFPIVAKSVMLALVELGKINKISSFTATGIDFQSSTALSSWESASDLAATVAFHEMKTLIYVKIRTEIEPQAKLLIVDGVAISSAQLRAQNQVKSRQFILIGLTGVDLISKVLWKMGLNCPPFDASPPMAKHSALIQQSLSDMPALVIGNDPNYHNDEVKEAMRTFSEAVRFNFESSGYGLPLGVMKIKVFLCAMLAKSAGVSADEFYGVVRKHFKEASETVHWPVGVYKTNNVYEMILEHLKNGGSDTRPKLEVEKDESLRKDAPNKPSPAQAPKKTGGQARS